MTRVQPGDPAPAVELPAADREGVVSLADHRGQRPVLLALFRGLSCPFCRWQLTRLAVTAEKLRELGVATLGVVASAPERTRLYFRFRPPRYPVGADPELRTHRAYGVPQVPMTPEVMQMVDAAATRMARDLGLPAEPGGAIEVFSRFDGFEPTEHDLQSTEREPLVGHFLVDREGIVRWINTERTPGEPPSDDELASVAKSL